MESWRQELYSSELYHHGILGQKWGVRRYQNDDGSLTAAGKNRYGNGVASNGKTFKNGKPVDRRARSLNPVISAHGGRKINADYETRRSRGETLSNSGRTTAGAIGRHIGRSILAGFGLSAISGGAGVIIMSKARDEFAAQAGLNAVNTVLQGLGTAFEVSNIIKTYQDISDMHTYRDSKNREN